VIEGDWLYGRGGADMKAGHAANLHAMDALQRIGFQPAATFYLQSVVEEESTGNGALMTHLRGYKVDAVLIPEPEDEKLSGPMSASSGFMSRSAAFPSTCARWAPAQLPSMRRTG